MLETPNVRACEVFPVWILPNGDDGKRKPFHVIHCLAQPKCNAELRLSPGRHSRLPPEAIVKYAGQKDWFADRRGYALCPLHRPGSKLRPPSDMPPSQKRAAFIAIRDRNIEAAATSIMDSKPPAEPEPDRRAYIAKLIAANEAAQVDPRLKRMDRELFDRLILDRKLGVHTSVAQMAEDFRVHSNTVTAAATRLVGFGYLRRKRAGHFIICAPPSASQTDPPCPAFFEKESAMPSSAMPIATVPETAPVKPPRVEAPREPVLANNRRIRRALDELFDEAAGRWTGDLSDEKVARELGYPRAWISRVRELYGDDRNEADEVVQAQATGLEETARALKDDALAIATRAEALEREVRRFLDGRA